MNSLSSFRKPVTNFSMGIEIEGFIPYSPPFGQIFLHEGGTMVSFMLRMTGRSWLLLVM